MSAPPSYKRTDFDRDRPELEACVLGWAEREACSFDDAVDGRPKPSTDEEGTIWDDMPAIDSKKAVGALVALEPIIGEKLPLTLIRPGGYDSGADLAADLLPKVRAWCATTASAGATSSGVAAAAGVQAHP